jgi:hypothetical protein
MGSSSAASRAPPQKSPLKIAKKYSPPIGDF